jgi:hypothetical protein
MPGLFSNDSDKTTAHNEMKWKSVAYISTHQILFIEIAYKKNKRKG